MQIADFTHLRIVYSLDNNCMPDSTETGAFVHALQIRLIIITASVLSSDFMWSNLTVTLPNTYLYNWRTSQWFKKVHLWSVNCDHVTVISAIPKSLIRNDHTNVLRRNSSKDWSPWRRHQWMPKRAGVKISVWFNLQNIVNKLWFLYIYIYIYIYAVLKRLATPSDFRIPLPSAVPFTHS
jgi:hypothetical protein